jgi:hypothetical protein
MLQHSSGAGTPIGVLHEPGQSHPETPCEIDRMIGSERETGNSESIDIMDTQVCVCQRSTDGIGDDG